MLELFLRTILICTTFKGSVLRPLRLTYMCLYTPNVNYWLTPTNLVGVTLRRRISSTSMNKKLLLWVLPIILKNLDLVWDICVPTASYDNFWTVTFEMIKASSICTSIIERRLNNVYILVSITLLWRLVMAILVQTLKPFWRVKILHLLLLILWYT